MNATPERAFLTRHAYARCREMSVERSEVVETLRWPTMTYPAPPEYGPGRRVATGKRLAVVYAENFVVITVLWNGQTSRDAGPLYSA